MNIEPMDRCHLKAVMEIERESFPIPWTKREMRLAALKQAFFSSLVVTQEETVLAYSVVALLGDTTREVLNFAVAREFRFQGVGTALMEFLKERDRRPLWIRLCGENLPGYAFLEKCGFKLRLKELRKFHGRRYTELSFCYNPARVDNEA